VRRFVPLLLLLTVGCVYYNGMYNARHFEKDARRAEQDGRTLDASSLWGQASVKAESVYTKHPHSRWADEARVIHGTAMQRQGDCPGALRTVEPVLASTGDASVLEEASFIVGRCREELGDPLGASQAFEKVIGSRDPVRRQEALYYHGRALRLEGHQDEALEELRRTNFPPAQGERGAALAGLGRTSEALAIVDSLIARRDSAAPFEAIIRDVGIHDAAAAAALVDRLVALPYWSPGLKAQWLLVDGLRAAPESPEIARERLTAAEQLAPRYPAGDQARIALVQMSIRSVGEDTGLEEVTARLEELRDRGGASSAEAIRLLALVRAIQNATKAATPGAPEGDMHLFLAAEFSRDSLLAPRLSVSLFRRMLDGWPDSPYAPKAVLALRQLQPSDSALDWDALSQRYAGSPYLAVLRGEDPPGYRALEDSLLVFTIRRYAVNGRPGATSPATAPGAIKPGARRPIEQ
jgi:outer membrane protein assembly factor BamD (BamD/ComL family)